VKYPNLWFSAGIDFAVTAGTAYLSFPQDTPMSWRTIITILVGSLVATAKGLRTYLATSPIQTEDKAA